MNHPTNQAAETIPTANTSSPHASTPTALWAALILGSTALAACGGSAPMRPVMAPSSGNHARSSYGSPTATPADATAAQSGATVSLEQAPAGAAKSSAAPAPQSTPGADYRGGATAERSTVHQQQAPKEERPGLGTAWGEDVYSPTRSTAFERSTQRPFLVQSFWYNNPAGVRAMTRGARATSRMDLNRGMITVRLLDSSGQPLPGLSTGQRDYFIGRAGQAYTISVQNHSPFRLECVGSVDGLDVINGQAASFDNRGYLIEPYGQLTIEGFRRSDSQVAAFRFSSVSASYSAQSGKGDRNVGVIGLAFFRERGSQGRWTPREVYRRRTADPFPGQYATPPRY